MGVDRYELDIAQLYQRYQEGASMRQLSRELGISATAIRARFDRHRLPVVSFRHEDIDAIRLGALLDEGLSQRAAARRLGVDRLVIWRKVQHMRRMGLLPPRRMADLCAGS